MTKYIVEVNKEVLNVNKNIIENSTPKITISENCGNGRYTVTVYDNWNWSHDQGKV